MIARTQWQPGAADLQTVLALARGGTLARAGERLGVDASTVFRALQRIERGLGRRLFERTRAGYVAGELALRLAEHGERLESTLESARSVLDADPGRVAGSVRITTTDTVLHGLVAPVLDGLRRAHPQLELELATTNELVSLTRRDADVAVRATQRPPAHLVGRRLGPIRVGVYAARGPRVRIADVDAGRVDWIAPDDALPEHPSVVWRRRQWPRLRPRYRVDSIRAVLELVRLGLGVGVLPLFLADAQPGLRRLVGPIDAAQTDLWLLAHPESRHLRRVAVTYAHLAERIVLR